MQQLKSKGEIFVLNPSGTVSKRITKFSDIIADVEERLPPLWEEEWNRKLYEGWLRKLRLRKEAKERLHNQRVRFAAVVGVVLAALIFWG